ncbi:DUF4012 domain-containing protein [Microbacterium sp. B2969]|uniref:DUF4012 domain-containing protein n=1 Tax=Microbacterium alkaliflavum TaxID=3248839 RepID=A0ABW7Q6A7_9MICO
MSGDTARRRGRRFRPVLVVSAVVLAVLLAASAWVVVRAVLVKNELEALVPVVGELQEAASSRDVSRLEDISATVGEHSERAASLTSDPVWRLAEALPAIGPNLTAVRVVADQLVILDRSAVHPLVDLMGSLGSGPEQAAGGFDLALAADAQAPLAKAANALHHAADTFGALPRASLIRQVRDAVDKLDESTTASAPIVGGLARAASVLPPLLGADGPRTILVMLQNNAELRTGGGITGAYVLLRAEGGRISMVQQADSGQFAPSGTDIVPIPESTTQLYGDVIGRFVQNATATSDFALSAGLASTWWQEKFGVTPDAVLSIDPLVLKSLLAVTGPVTLPDGSQLSSDNLVQRLLIDPYLTLDPVQQTAFLQAVTGAVFSQLLASPDVLNWAEALAAPVEQGRVSVWSAHPAEQALIDGTAIAGPLARHADAGDDAFAVYFNDVTGGKMDVFLDVSMTVGTADCRSDGRRDVSIVVTMGSRAPADAAASLPFSVTGGGLLGTGNGDIGTIVTVAAPPGWFYGGVWKNGEPEVSTNVVDNGHPSTGARVNLSPGETNTMEYRFVSAEPGAVAPTIVHTPLVDDVAISADDATCRG